MKFSQYQNLHNDNISLATQQQELGLGKSPEPIEMGKVKFTHGKIGGVLPEPESIMVENSTFTYYVASVEGPHCVIFVDELSPFLASHYGSIIGNLPRFANKTNVQFVKVLDRQSIQLESWTREHGYVLTSLPSSVACAAVSHALGYCGPKLDVYMPSAIVQVELDTRYNATVSGTSERLSKVSGTEQTFY